MHTGHVVNGLNSFSCYSTEVSTRTTEVLAKDVVAQSGDILSWSHDGSKLAFVGNEKDDPNTDDVNNGFPGRCYVIDLHRPELRQIGGLEFAQRARIHWSPDDTTLYVRTFNNDVKAVSLRTGQGKSLLDPGLVDVWGNLEKEEGDIFHVIGTTKEGERRIYQTDTRLQTTRIVSAGFKYIYDLSRSRDGSRAAWRQQDVGHPDDLWVGNGDLRNARQL